MCGAMPRAHGLCCFASPSSGGRRTPPNSRRCYTKCWWPRWPPIWASNPPSSTRRSTTSEPRPESVRSDDAALEAATFPLGEPAPDTEPLVVGQGVIQAPVLHLAAQADALGLAG